MKVNLKRIMSAAAAAAVTTASVQISASAIDFGVSSEGVSILESNRLSMPSDADVSFGIPEFKSLIGQEVDDITDLSPVARYGAISEEINILGTDASLPESFDMRSEGTITSVKNQGSYGTCWTFSSAASAETSLLDTIPWIDLSEWHTAYYPYTGGNQIDIGDATLDEQLQYGGTIDVVTNLWAQWIGPISEEKLPYGDESLLEDASTVNKYSSAADYHLENAYFLDYDEELDNRDSVNSVVKQFIYDGYAVDVSFSTKGYSYSTNSTYSLTDYTKANHSVVIAGWDDNYTASNFDGNVGAWLCRNSWDTGFGDNGYFWISYDDTSLCEFAVFELNESDNYAENYQHDTFIPTQTMSAFSDESTNGISYMANVFTAEADEQIEAVSTYIINPDTEYEITVYTNLSDPSDPSSGTASSVTCGVSELTGYATIELDEDVYIEKGEQFAISVGMYCEETPFVLPLETCMLLIDDETGEVTELGSYTTYEAICEYTGENESFYSEDGSNWIDVTEENYEYSEEEKNQLVENTIEASGELTDEQIEEFRALFEGCTLTVVMGNFSFKAFANPVNTVDFSHISGNVPTNEQVSLSVKDGEDIYCTINGGEEFLHTEPISVDEEMEISATTDHVSYTVKNYTPAKAEFIDIGYFTSAKYTDNNDILYAERQDSGTYNIELSGAENSVQLFFVSAAEVYQDGEEVEKNEFTSSISLDYGLNQFVFVLSQENRLDNTVTVNIYRNPVDIDLETETVTFSGLTLTAADGTVFESGDSVSEYAGQTLTASADGTDIEIQVPERAEVPELELDYLNETLNFLPNETAEFAEYAIGENPDESSYKSVEGRCIDGQNITSGMVMNQAFRVIPGETITLRIAAGNGMFGSEAVVYEIPEAGAAPTEAAEYSIEAGKIVLQYSDTLEYGMISGSLTEDELSELAEAFGYETEEYVSVMMNRYGTSNRTELLELLETEWDAVFEVETDYSGKLSVAVRYYADDEGFASEAVINEITYTVKGDVNFDKVIDAIDASMVLSYYAKTSVGIDPEISDEVFEAGNFNSDNVLDAVDASEILSYYAKKAMGQI